jgi:hypothetical protein
VFVATFTTAAAIFASELPEPDVVSLLPAPMQSSWVWLRIHGGECATGGEASI